MNNDWKPRGQIQMIYTIQLTVQEHDPMIPLTRENPGSPKCRAENYNKPMSKSVTILQSMHDADAGAIQITRQQRENATSDEEAGARESYPFVESGDTKSKSR